MFSDTFLQSIVRTALSRGGDYCDLFIEDRDDTAISFDNGKIRGITTGTTAGAGIRIIYGVNYVYLYSGNPGEQALTELAERAAALPAPAGQTRPTPAPVRARGGSVPPAWAQSPGPRIRMRAAPGRYWPIR